MTEEGYAEAISRAGLTFADGILATARKEEKGCTPRWDKYLCWLKQIKAAQFFQPAGDLDFYNIMLSIAGLNHTNPVIDPSAQPPEGSVVIIITPETGGQPAARQVIYSDTHWNIGHTVYTEPLWAGFDPQIYINGQRFLQEGVEFTSSGSGGFVLTSPMVDGDTYYVIF